MMKQRSIPESVNVLLVGTGGREHALARRLVESPGWAPLGPGWRQRRLAELGRTCPEAIPDQLGSNERFRLRKFLDEQQVRLVVVGPEVPWPTGSPTSWRPRGGWSSGPGRRARLEADKGYAKDLMRSAAVPTAEGRSFTDHRPDLHRTRGPLRGQGRRARRGKGVVVCDDAEQGLAAVDLIMGRGFGAAGETVVVEERLEGQERACWRWSTAGRSRCSIPARTQAGRGGGRGSQHRGWAPTARRLGRAADAAGPPRHPGAHRRRPQDGVEFRVLYAGLMLTPSGPKVLEFNVRFGDPECQPLMTRLRGDLVELLWRTAAGTLARRSSSSTSGPPARWCSAPKATPGPIPRASRSRASSGRNDWTGSRSSMRAPRGTNRGAWSPAVDGSSGSPHWRTTFGRRGTSPTRPATSSSSRGVPPTGHRLPGAGSHVLRRGREDAHGSATHPSSRRGPARTGLGGGHRRPGGAIRSTTRCAPGRSSNDPARSPPARATLEQRLREVRGRTVRGTPGSWDEVAAT